MERRYRFPIVRAGKFDQGAKKANAFYRLRLSSRSNYLIYETRQHMKIQFTALHCSLLLVSILTNAQSPNAQGTIDFEGFAPGTLPPFIIPVMNNPPSGVRVRSGTITIPAYEGERYLWSGGTIRLEAPEGMAIKSFSLYFYTDPVTPTTRAFFSAGGYSAQREDFGKWSLARGSFETPVQSLTIGGIKIEGQIFPLIYRIDAVELELVPKIGLNEIP